MTITPKTKNISTQALSKGPQKGPLDHAMRSAATPKGKMARGWALLGGLLLLNGLGLVPAAQGQIRERLIFDRLIEPSPSAERNQAPFYAERRYTGKLVQETRRRGVVKASIQSDFVLFEEAESGRPPHVPRKRLDMRAQTNEYGRINPKPGIGDDAAYTMACAMYAWLSEGWPVISTAQQSEAVDLRAGISGADDLYRYMDDILAERAEDAVGLRYRPRYILKSRDTLVMRLIHHTNALGETLFVVDCEIASENERMSVPFAFLNNPTAFYVGVRDLNEDTRNLAFQVPADAPGQNNQFQGLKKLFSEYTVRVETSDETNPQFILEPNLDFQGDHSYELIFTKAFQLRSITDLLGLYADEKSPRELELACYAKGWGGLNLQAGFFEKVMAAITGSEDLSVEGARELLAMVDIEGNPDRQLTGAYIYRDFIAGMDPITNQSGYYSVLVPIRAAVDPEGRNALTALVERFAASVHKTQGGSLPTNMDKKRFLVQARELLESAWQIPDWGCFLGDKKIFSNRGEQILLGSSFAQEFMDDLKWLAGDTTTPNSDKTVSLGVVHIKERTY